MHSKKQYALLAICITLTVFGVWLGISEGEIMGFAVSLLFATGIAMTVGEMWPKLFHSESPPAESLKEKYPGPLHLRASRGMIIFIGVCGASMGTGTLLMALYDTAAAITQIMLWGGAIFFLGGAAVALFKGIGANRLCLRGNEMELIHGGRRTVTRWADTSSFDTASVPGTATTLIVFDDANARRSATAKMNRKMFGCSSALPNSYGLTPGELVDLLNDWRARALTTEDSIQ